MQYKYFFNSLLVCFLLTAINARALKPIIINHSESVNPGEIIGLQGSNFGLDPKVYFMHITGNEPALNPQKELSVLTQSAIYAAARIPGDTPQGLYAIWIKNGEQLSEPVLVNLARGMTAEYDEIMPGTTFRIFGRNLWFKGKKAGVRFVHPKTGTVLEVPLKGNDPYEMSLTAPAGLLPETRYAMYVYNGAGGKYGYNICSDSISVRKSGTDPFHTGVPWGADFSFYNNVYNVKTDNRLSQKAKGDGVNNDRAAIQEAIDLAAKDGGGVVYLPAGKYKLAYSTGSGISMRSNVVLKGDGLDKSIIKYGYGQPFTKERVKASYGWTLGWPDSRTEGMAMVWPGLITTSGLIDLFLENVNESGEFLHTIKNMPEGGSKIILKNCSFDLSTGWGLAMVNIDKLLMTGCELKSSSIDVRGINAPTRTWPFDFKNSSYCIVRDNKINYYAGRLGLNGCHHTILENNDFIRDGDHQSKGETGGLSMDYTLDIIIQKNRFLVTGAAIKNNNQGETILSQGCNPHQQSLGTLTSATETTVKDNRTEWQDFTDRVSTDWQYAVHPMNYVIAIVEGEGTGQWRTITGNNDTILTVDRPWDVIPAPASRYVITQWSIYKGLIKDNILKDNHQGIMLYGGGTDVVITGNELTNSGGIYLRSDQRMQNKRYNLTWNVSVVDNKVINTNGLRSAHVAMYHVKVANDNTKIFGIGTIGIEMRRNLLQASIPNVGKAGGSSGLGAEGYFNYVTCGNSDKSPCDFSKIAIVGTIMENNIAINTDNAYKVSQSVVNTLIVPGRTENVENLIKDEGGPKTGTFIDLKENKPKNK